VTNATKAQLARTVIGGLMRVSFRAGRLVERATASRRGVQRGAHTAGLRAKQFGGDTRNALEKAPQLRRELHLLRRELPARPTRARMLAVGITGVLVGAAGAYLLVAQSGKRRRDKARNVGSKVIGAHGPPQEGEVAREPEAKKREEPAAEQEAATSAS
jgi:hypothetical protein